MASDNYLKIADWMKGQTVFITGVSGFIGKILLYKLLKSCSDVESVYVLLRSKKGKKTEDRLKELLSCEIFDEFKNNNPAQLAKVEAIEGDICKERLGIHESDWQLLQNQVTTVFHIAASVRFDDPLQKAIFTNTRSAKYALLLAKGIKNLKVFVHVSTAYTNSRFSDIPEEVILTDVDPHKIITIAESSDEHKLEVLSEKILKGYPNTYIFTKNLAEALVYESKDEIPVVIVRPSIVLSSAKEPKPGWCDSMSSMSALFGAAGKGVSRVVYGNFHNVMDFTTVDTCANATIAAAWYRDVHFPSSDTKSFVFNVTDMRLAIGYTADLCTNLQYIYPLRNQLWKGFSMFISNSLYFHLMTFLLHLLPGFFMDMALKINGKQPMLIRIYRKLYVVGINLKHFLTTSYNFDTRNFKMLGKLIREEEKETFFTDFYKVSTEEKYVTDCAIGGRALMGDPPEIFKEDIQRVHRLYWIDMILRLALLGLIISILPFKSTYDWSVCKANEFQEYFIALDVN